MESTDTQNNLPACVLPRRRFVRWLLTALFLCNLVCVVVRFYAVHHPDWSVLWEDLELGGLMLLLVFGPLLIPVRTKRGSLLQVLGLVFALLLTWVICSIGWESYLPNDPYLHRMAHGMVVFWMGVVTFLYVYIPVCLIHLILCFIEKRRARKN